MRYLTRNPEFIKNWIRETACLLNLESNNEVFTPIIRLNIENVLGGCTEEEILTTINNFRQLIIDEFGFQYDFIVLDQIEKLKPR